MIDFSEIPGLTRPTTYPVNPLAQILTAVNMTRQFQSAQAQEQQARAHQEAGQRLLLLHQVAGTYLQAGQEPPQDLLAAISQAQQALGLPGVQQQTTPGTPAVPTIPGATQGTPSEIGPQAAQPVAGIPGVPPSQRYVLPGASQRAEATKLAQQTAGQFAQVMGRTLRQGVDPNLLMADVRRQGVNPEALLEQPSQSVTLLDTRTGETQTVQLPPGGKLQTYASPGQPAQHVIIYPDGRQQMLPPGIVPTMAPASEGPINVYNTRTGQTIKLPPGTKLYTPPNAPEQQVIVYPDGHREVVPSGQRLTFAPPAQGGGQISPADREVLGIYLDVNKYNRVPADQQDAFNKRVQQVLANIGIPMPAQRPPANNSFWDKVKTFLGGAIPKPGPAPATPGAGAKPPAGKNTYDTTSSGVVTVAQVRAAIANMQAQGLAPAQIRQKLQEDKIPPGDFGF